MRIITKGATDQQVVLYVVDNTTGLPASIAYNASGIDLWYRREGASATSITEVTQTVSGAHTDGGFVSIANGAHRLDSPDAAFSSGVDTVTFGGTATGYTIYPVTVQLVGFNLQTGVTPTGDAYAIVNNGTHGNAALKALIDTLDDYVDTEVAAIKAKTDALPSDPADQSLIIDATNAIIAAIAALNNLSAAQVNAQVLDVLNVDTFGEPSGVPGATITLAEKIGWLFMALRNRVDVTSSKKTFYDDSNNAEWEKDLTDNGTTYSESEGSSI